MLVKTNTLDWIYQKPLTIRANLCAEHSAVYVAEGYDPETAENKKLKVFAPKLRNDIKPINCDVKNCNNSSNHQVYNLKVKSWEV